jgi:hypothetical protein
MSSSKADRAVAPRGQGTRPSRAKHTKDRNVTPPAAKPTAARKPKKGMRVMDAQLAAKAVEAPKPPPPVIDVDVVEKDPWWTDERDKAYVLTVQGVTKSQIARELGRERHTIGAWQEDERFSARLQEENVDRFRASRQRRTIQTLRLTDKAHDLAHKMLDNADANPKDLNSRLAARDWLNEFREQSRREDEIYGLDNQRVDVNVRGGLTHQHNHRGSVNLSFKEFLTGAMKKLGVDVETEEIDATRADDALVAVAERALMEGTFLEDLVEREKEEQLASRALPVPGR